MSFLQAIQSMSSSALKSKRGPRVEKVDGVQESHQTLELKDLYPVERILPNQSVEKL